MATSARPRFQNPAPRPSFRALYRGDAVGVFDWRCPGCDTPAHEAEYNDAYEVVVVRQGTFVREVNGSPALVTAGTLMFATAGEMHRISHPVPGGDHCSVFRGSLPILREMLGVVSPDQQDRIEPTFPLRQTAIGGRQYLLHRLAMRAAAGGTDPVEQEESALWFLYSALGFACASRHGAPTRSRALQGTQLRKALAYGAAVEELVGRTFASPMSLAQIGRAVECSPFHLSRLVRAATGLSIHRIVVRRRLRHALDLVLDSRAGLSAIALAAGFGSHSHLTDAFRREFGCSPDRVRRRSAKEIRGILSA